MKFGAGLCFCVVAKTFAVTSVESENSVSFNCTPEKFAELTELDGINHAPYVARCHWIHVEKPDALALNELEDLISKSHLLVFDKLSAKVCKILSER